MEGLFSQFVRKQKKSEQIFGDQTKGQWAARTSNLAASVSTGNLFFPFLGSLQLAGKNDKRDWYPHLCLCLLWASKAKADHEEKTGGVCSDL